MRCFMHEWLTVVREKCKVRFKPGGGITSFRKSKAISKRQVILQNMLPLGHKYVLHWFSFFRKGVFQLRTAHCYLNALHDPS